MAASPLRVLLNATAVPQRPAGAGVYTIELARALARRDDVDLTIAAPQAIVVGARHVTSPAAGPLPRIAWEATRLRSAIRESDAQVYHGAHFDVPRGLRAGLVATVHDLTFFRIPRRYDWRRRLYYRWIARTARRADRVIVPSRAVAGDVIHYLGYPPERIRVVAEAPRAGLAAAGDAAVGAFRQRLGVQGPYLLCVGTAEPGKRAVDAIRALAQLADGGAAPALVLAGNPGPLSAALAREAAKLGVAERVMFVGYVADEEMAALYSGATALIFPSLWEGFGLPPLEAMACGTPVISSSAPAMSEVLDGAAIFVRPGDHEGIAREARRLLDDAAWRAEWQARGLAHAAGFSWDRAAAETMDVYREVAGL